MSHIKSQIKIGTEVTLKLSSIMVGDSNNDTGLPPKLLVINTQV